MSNPPDPAAPDPAKARLLAMTMVRLSGAAMVLLALAIIAGKIDLPRLVAVILGLLGMFEVLVMPLILAKRWKTPEQ